MNRPELVLNVIGMPGTGKSTYTEYLRAEHGFAVHRPSDVIRAHAAAIGHGLASRADYNLVHGMLLEEDPDAMVRPILEDPERLVAIDGLRVMRHARILKSYLGERMRTCALDCPQDVRARRIYEAAEFRAHRDASQLETVEDVIGDEVTENNPGDELLPNVYQVMQMHDLSDRALDTNRPTDIVKAELSALLQPILLATTR